MFVSFEGPDGSGKSTAIQAVAQELRKQGLNVVTTRQPGDSSLGVRKVLLESHEIEPLAELFLFLADRAQHVAELIRPALEEGKIVLCDRYADSTIVYQGYGRGLDLELLRQLNDIATKGLKPDLTILLDLSPQEAQKRLSNHDRLDRESNDFRARVRDGFLKEAQTDRERWFVIDSSQTPEAVSRQCLEAVLDRLRTSPKP